MRTLGLTLVLLLLAPHAIAQAQPGKDDHKNIQGTWTFAEMEVDGVKKKPPKALTFKIGPDRIEVSEINDPSGYKLGVNGGVGTFDSIPEKGNFAGQTKAGIYILKGDTLTICFAGGFGDPRPTKFTSKEGQLIIYLQRVKP